MGDEVIVLPSADTLDSKSKESVELSDEQRCALNAVKEGRNIFITGSAGVGKSFLLKEILKSLPSRSSYVTASTGVAACNIGGTTLHSFAGIGLGEKSAMTLAKNIIGNRSKKEVLERWRKCRVLVIDEISMIDGHLFEKVEKVARIVRQSDSPFGGIQIILCGDFLQLPPVKSSYFAFESKSWSEVVQETILLKKVFRQKEMGLVTLLNRLRMGQFKPLDIDVLSSCRHTTFPDDGIKPTRLFPHRYSCDNVNISELRKLSGATVVYDAIDNASKPVYQEMMEKNSKFPTRLELKVGAQVMLLINKNIKGHLVNGARGVVIGFRDKSRSLEEQVQLLVDEQKEVDIGGLGNKDLFDKTIIIKDDDEEDDESYEEYHRGEKSPIVRFANGIVDVVNRDKSTIAVGGKNVATRLQIPLLLAWAVSIHKSQGMTLDRIDVSIAKVFEHGQAYVALSRVTSLDGMLLREFNASRITAHPKVLTYYKKIDPAFDCLSTDGETELRAFINRKSNAENYDNLLKQIKDRNESNPGCSNSNIDYTSGKQELHDLPEASLDLLYCKTEDLDDSATDSPKADYCNHSSMLKKENNAACTSNSVKTETSATWNKSSIDDIDILSSKDQTRNMHGCCSNSFKNVKEKFIDLRESLSGVKEESSYCSSNDLPRNPTQFDYQKNSDRTSEPIVILTDSDSEPAETCNSRTPARNDFLNFICPDLLDSSESVQRENILHHISKRRKIESDNEEKSNSRINMKQLLVIKASEIEKKRKAALERRRLSQQRSNSDVSKLNASSEMKVLFPH